MQHPLQANRPPKKKCRANQLPGTWVGEYALAGSGSVFMLVMEVESVENCQVKGSLHWPDFFNCKSSFIGEIDGTQLRLKETGFLQGYNMEYNSSLTLALTKSDTLHGKWEDEEGQEIGSSFLVNSKSLSHKQQAAIAKRLEEYAATYGTALLTSEKAGISKEEFMRQYWQHNDTLAYRKKAVEVEGTAVFGQVELPLYMAFRYPDHLYMELQIQNLKFQSGSNPDNKWKYDPMKDKAELTPRKEAAAEEADLSEEDLHGLLKKGYTFKNIQEAQLDSIPTYRLLLEKEGSELVYFIDKRNFQTVRKEGNLKVEYMLRPQKVHGYYLPTLYYQLSPSEVSRFYYTSMNPEAEISDSLFYLPASLLSKVEKPLEKNSDYYNQLGIENFEAGAYEEAVKNYTRAIKMNPGPLNYYLNRGNARTKLQDFYGAISDFTFVLEYEPKNAKAHNFLGLAKYYLGDYKNAIEDFSKAIRHDSSLLIARYNRGFAYIQLQEFENAEPNFAHIVRYDTAANPEYQYYYAVVLGQVNKLDSSVYHFSKAIANGYEGADIYNRRGVVYYKAGKLQEAKADFEEAIRQDPSDYLKYQNLANLYADLEEYRKSIDIYEKALRLAEEKAEIYNRIGLNFYSLEIFDNAKENFSKAILENPKNATYYDNRASARKELMDFSGAINDYTTSLSLYPDDANIHLARGLLQVNQHNRHEGCKDFQKARELGLEEAQDMINEYCTLEVKTK